MKELQQIVTTTNAAEIAARESFYKVPVVSATMITLVTKASICSKAATALTKFERSREPVIATTGTAAKPPSTAGAPSSRTVVVVKHDTFWAVQDPSRSPNGRLLTTVIFDARWRMVGGYSGP